ncbi:MAG: DUF4177 domain-containing protein [Pseudomonadota bacterium]
MNWEYKTITFDKRQHFTGNPRPKELTHKLNIQGAQGWELVSIVPPTFTGASAYTAVFKRPK